MLFAGGEQGVGPQAIYVASNAWWNELQVKLPELPASARWTLVTDTWCEGPMTPCHVDGGQFTIRPRSVMVFLGR